jgi:hypothetical protein
MFVLLAVDPVLATAGQVAVVVICFYVLVSLVLLLVVNAVLAYALNWVRDKTELVKLLRPKIKEVNDVVIPASKGKAPAEDAKAIGRAVARVPIAAHATEKKVEQVTDRVAEGVIEFRSRMLQVQTIAKTFFLPGLIKPEARLTKREREDGLEFRSPGYRMLMERNAPEIPVAPTAGNGSTDALEAEQITNVAAH